ncbi:MAG: class I SAM-dependent methyltransferase [Campylobacterota bacterium]|nr:class I SAM-dependent methyltransferase [Campylobacterota bacterium]
MQPLDLYATIEQYLEFDEEISVLYSAIKNIVVDIWPNSLIDIGCGQGDFCKLLNDNGIDTLGVDLSAKQIEIASLKGIISKCIDIKDIKEKYDCATAVFDVINYLSRDYIKEFLQNTYNLLNDGGYFIFDINSLYGFDEVAQGTLNIDTDDKFIAIDANFDDDILYTDITLFSKQSRDYYTKDTGTIKQYYYDNDSLIDILNSVGFEIEEIKSFNLHSSESNDKYIYVCKK